MTDRMPETPLRFEISVGTAVAHAGHTVVILKALDGSKVRVRDVATAAELDVSVAELKGSLPIHAICSGFVEKSL